MQELTEYWAEFPPPHEALRIIAHYFIGERIGRTPTEVPRLLQQPLASPQQPQQVNKQYTSAEEMIAIFHASPYAH